MKKLWFVISLIFLIGIFLCFRTGGDTYPHSYAELTEMSEDRLADIDIERLNLLCARGLNGADELDVDKGVKVIENWALMVKAQIDKYLPTYFRNPAKYDNSISKFTAINLVLSIQQDLNCGYNKQLIKSGAMSDIQSTRFFGNSKDLFLHGFIENRSGSCASLPVLVVAIGRKCNMPLYLVTCKGHLFCRWDDGKERFNIEASGSGVDIKPDSYYRNWPHRLTDDEIKTEGYLKNLSPMEELSVFSQLRGTCFMENKEYGKAKDAFRFSLKAYPNSKYIKSYLNSLKGKI